MDSSRGAIHVENVAYEIDKVVGKRLLNGQLKYQVAVKGFSRTYWFPAEALKDSQLLIREFERKTAGSQGGNKSHGCPIPKNELDRRFDVITKRLELDQKLLAQLVPQVTELKVEVHDVKEEVRDVKDEVRDHDQRLAAVELKLGARAGPSGSGVVAAAANGHVDWGNGAQQQHGQGPRALKVPCVKCGKPLAKGYVKRHFKQNKCGQRPGRPAKRFLQE